MRSIVFKRKPLYATNYFVLRVRDIISKKRYFTFNANVENMYEDYY